MIKTFSMAASYNVGGGSTPPKSEWELLGDGLINRSKDVMVVEKFWSALKTDAPIVKYKTTMKLLTRYIIDYSAYRAYDAGPRGMVIKYRIRDYTNPRIGTDWLDLINVAQWNDLIHSHMFVKEVQNKSIPEDEIKTVPSFMPRTSAMTQKAKDGDGDLYYYGVDHVKQLRDEIGFGGGGGGGSSAKTGVLQWHSGGLLKPDNRVKYINYGA